MTSIPIAGHCPMGCGEKLVATVALSEAASGYAHSRAVLHCSSAGCPAPGAIDELLDGRGDVHLVQLGEDYFEVQHPLRERLQEPGDGHLFGCTLHRRLGVLDEPPATPGRYRAYPDDGPATIPGWRLERIEDDER